MNEKIKILKTIHLAICAGVIITYIMLGGFSMETLKIPILDSSSIVFAVLPFLAIFVGNFLFKSQLKQADQNLKIEEKLPVYQTASIIRWAILEGVAFVILFSKPDLVLFGLIAIAYLIFLRPTEDKINADFQNV
ncbi:MFS transporter [Flavobacterium sp. LC2016-12]|uniref:MFS transporter n=1 Tax=Flavobacterium sp. LC2016-12 TaxID=2783794 RepID=UPI00188BD184|nr:MFS transporter [Flavobacterium sp. LC2016-12]MBF4467457.1 MFS transporter [Flavobacterium sp. LC2016-12]